ncbi:MAG TPA: hypothetical protein VG734_13930 [Lacunisphaera sp.]|nr:hypothetical protein [Lacunisphaera sp.]
MKSPSIPLVLSFLLLPFLTVLPSRAASFSADLLNTQHGQTQPGKFYYQNGGYRLEISADGQELILLVDGATGLTRLLNPKEKAYYEARAGEPMSLMINPFALYAQYARVKEVRVEGTESVGGVACRKQVVHAGEQVYVTGWVADGYEIPLKVHVELGGHTIELRNLKPGPQDPALFVLPAGYRLEVMGAREEPQPEWIAQVAPAPLLTPPFEKALPEGGIVRMRPQAGRWVELAGTNTGKTQGSFTVAPFKGGKYTGGGSMSTLILDAGDSGAMNTGARPETTDEIVVRVGQGSMKIKATYIAPPPPRPGEAPVTEQPAAEAKKAASPDDTAELQVPATAGIAVRLEIPWKGPGNRDDYLTISRSEQPPGAYVERAMVREGNPLKIWAPSDAGDYEVRYIAGRGQWMLARVPITITAVAATVEPVATVPAGAWIEVKWTGPARDGDFITVASHGQAPSASLGRTVVKEGNPLKVRAPNDAGVFEVRYVLGRGYRVLATAPVTTTAITAEIPSPGSGVAGTELSVAWKGPGYPEDAITVARADQPLNANVAFATVRKGNPLKLRLPKEAGTYELRYIFGRGNRVLAKTPVTVTAP